MLLERERPSAAGCAGVRKRDEGGAAQELEMFNDFKKAVDYAAKIAIQREVSAARAVCGAPMF